MFDDEEEICEDDPGTMLSKFDDNFKILNDDIKVLDTKLSSISGHILVIESNISHLQQTIKNAHQKGSDTGGLYNSMNRLYELLTMLQRNYKEYFDLKFKYRISNDDLKFKIIRIDDLEKQKLNTAFNSSDVVSAVSKIMSDNSKLDEIANDLSLQKYQI